MNLWDFKHPYYCESMNYYVAPATKDEWGSTLTFKSWAEFWAKFNEGSTVDKLDIDMNLIFRWDFTHEKNNTKTLQLSIMHQRKGAYRPVFIKNIQEKELVDIFAYLQTHWERIKEMWKPFTIEGWPLHDESCEGQMCYCESRRKYPER